jgi:hypothetical protein
VDISARREAYRSEGWSRFDEKQTEPYTPLVASAALADLGRN